MRKTGNKQVNMTGYEKTPADTGSLTKVKTGRVYNSERDTLTNSATIKIKTAHWRRSSPVLRISISSEEKKY